MDTFRDVVMPNRVHYHDMPIEVRNFVNQISVRGSGVKQGDYILVVGRVVELENGELAFHRDHYKSCPIHISDRSDFDMTFSMSLPDHRKVFVRKGLFDFSNPTLQKKYAYAAVAFFSVEDIPLSSNTPVASEEESNFINSVMFHGILASVVFIAALVIGNLGPTTDASSNGGISTRSYESTEDKLRRVYDSQGIKYDDRMIREDARAIEQLHSEFGK